VDEEERPDWNERWWMAHSRQNHMEPVGKRDYFDRPRRSPADDPAWPEPSEHRTVKANWRNDGPNWGERERERLTTKPKKPEPEFIVEAESKHNDCMIDGMRQYFRREEPLYLDPRMLHRPRKNQFG
jgi:hypothetical protein